MIQLPKITSHDSGLFFRYPSFHAIVYVGGQTRLRSLRTGDIDAARRARDTLYAKLTTEGATSRDGKTGRKGPPDGITPMFRVSINGHKARYVKTMEEAIEVSDWMRANHPPS